MASPSAANAVRSARRIERQSMTSLINPGAAAAAGGPALMQQLQTPLDRDARDLATAEALAGWLTHETGLEVRGDSREHFVEDLWSGVVFCRLCRNSNSSLKFSDPPNNEFQRLENFDLVARSMRELSFASQPPNAKAGNALTSFLPSLLEFAIRSKKDAEAMDQDSMVTEELVQAANESGVVSSSTPAAAEAAVGDVVVVSAAGGAEEEEEKDAAVSFGYLQMMERLEHVRRPC